MVVHVRRHSRPSHAGDLLTIGRDRAGNRLNHAHSHQGSATTMNATTVPTGTVLVDELRIRYADSGADGPVIVLTSPWPESLFAFRRVWPALARTARLVSLDLPGFGYSEGRADVFTPSAMGEFLLRFIAERGLGTPHLVAPDVGASAALFLAARQVTAGNTKLG
jgi:hypothetical protein